MTKAELVEKMATDAGISKVAAKKALQFLRKGTKSLFIKGHIFMIDYSIKFFARQIGAEKFLDIF